MPKPILIILVPVELLRFFVVQPFTLGVRLFANMFAGHLLLLIFTLARWYLAERCPSGCSSPRARSP